MLLLRNLVEDSLDEGYARAAARRGGRRAGPDVAPSWCSPSACCSSGLLLATAFAQTRQRAGSAAEARDALVAEVEQRSDRQRQGRRRRLDQQRADGAAGTSARRSPLSGAGTELADRLARLEAATGAGAGDRAGLVVRLDDAPPATATAPTWTRAPTSTTPAGSPTATCRRVVNEVWASGAEAVAVNGQRLTALSAIRAAGDAILVDFRPLTPPYDDRGRRRPAQAPRRRSWEASGAATCRCSSGYGITYAVDDSDRLQLAASAGVRLRYAAEPQPAETRSNGT